MSIGIFICLSTNHRIKQLIGLSIFQTSVIFLYLFFGFINDSTIPLLKDGYNLYSNPLPHVLMLTAIVVGVATLAVGLSLSLRLKKIEEKF